LKFYPGNKKSSPPVDFDGGRDEEGIITWLKEHTTHPWVDIGEIKGSGAGHDDLWSNYIF